MDVKKLFKFRKYPNEYSFESYAIGEYLKKDDPDVTELEIPAEHNGIPVTVIWFECFKDARFLTHVTIPGSVSCISNSAFYGCRALETVELNEGLISLNNDAFAHSGLRRVKLPKSLRELGFSAFEDCRELESVEFGSEPIVFHSKVFHGCGKLPLETFVMGLVYSTDITKPIPNDDLKTLAAGHYLAPEDYFRPDIFEFLAKHRNFRGCNPRLLFETIIDHNLPELFPIAEKYKMLSNGKLVDILTKHAIKRQTTELTAYLLDLNNRKFGFKQGDDNDL